MAKSRRSRRSRKSRKSRKSRRSARPANRWIKALKKYNQGRAKYTIPKKGSAEYKAVLRLMDKC